MGQASGPSGEDPRAALERLAVAAGADYAALSRLIGRNPAYIQQYMKRGTPRRLAEEDRRTLARFFGVDEGLLGAPPAAVAASPLVPVPRLAVAASAGPGALVGEEAALGALGFDPAWLKARGWRAERLSILTAEGDSMQPVLHDGDTLLCEAVAGGRWREGIHVLRMDGALLVKRVAPGPGGTLAVTSDNPAAARWPACPLEEVELIARVVWVGRTLG